MALSVGDAVLTFLGDTSQLDQAFNKIATEAGQKLGAATGAIQGTTTAVEQMTKSMAVGQQGAVELGEVTDLAGKKVEESMYQARGTIGLLVDATGIDLPRHVRSFLAEIPGVGIALSAAFEATAVLFLIAAFVEGVKKIVEFAEGGERLKQAWAAAALELENITIKEGDHTKSMELANLKLDDQIAKLEKRPETNKLREALIETGIAADALAAKFSTDFEKMTAEINAATSITSQFSIGLKSVLSSGVGGDFLGLTGGLAAGVANLGSLKDALGKVEEKLLEINKLRIDQANAKTEAQQIEAAKALAEAYGSLAQTSANALQAVKLAAPDNIKLITQLSSTIVTATAAQKDFGLEVDNVHKKMKVAGLEEAADAKKIWADKMKDIDHYRKLLNDLEKEQEKHHAKLIKDSEQEKSELTAANNAIAQVELTNFRKMEQAALVFIDGELKATEAATERKAELLKFEFDRGQLTRNQYIAAIKKLYADEQKTLLDFLTQKQQLVVLEAQKEAFARGQIMTVAEAKELKGFVELENQKRAVIDKTLKVVEKDIDDATKHAAKARPTWDKFFDDIISGSLNAGAALKELGALTAEAIGQSVTAAVTGSQSFGQAMAQMLKSALGMLAGKAVVKVLEELAEAASDLADPFMAWHAGFHFTAAAEWAAVAAAAGGAAAALGGGGAHGGAGAGSGPQIDKSNPNTQTGTNPSGGRNVPHLAEGGLITSPTLAMIGEGGREAVIPLNDGAMNMLAEAIARHSRNAGGGGDTFYFQPKGMVSSDTLGKLAKKLSRQVQTGRARLVANNALKTTRRA